MKTIVRTTNPTVISFAVSVLKDAGVGAHVFDANISVVEGSIGIFPRRIAVEEQHERRARAILREAGLGHELEPEKGRTAPSRKT